MRLAIALCLLATTGLGQTFDVASVKINRQPIPAPAGGPGGPPPPPPPPLVVPSPTGVTITGVTLKYCLQWAYNIRPWQITGPDWIADQRHDIVAKTAAPVDVSQLKLMLQALLADRFRMTVHREKKDARVMALVQAPGGHKLKAAVPGREFSIKATRLDDGRVHFEYTNAGLSVLEGLFTLPSAPPVLDMTALTGTFDVVFDRPSHLADNNDAWSGDLRSAIEKQLGLRLEPRRAPVEYLVIDSASRTPVEN